jgi:hypothetical protein
MINLENLLGINNIKSFEELKSKIIEKYEPDFIKKETTEIRILYPKDKSKETDIFLFNNKITQENFVSTRSKVDGKEKYKIITDLVDKNFLSLIKLLQLFDLKQTFIVESDVYKIGDCTIEFSKLYMEADKYKNFLFCLNNPYGHTYETTFNFSKEVLLNLFEEVTEQQIIDSCGNVIQELLHKYCLINKEKKDCEDELNNTMSENFPQIKLIQYIHYLFQ